MKPSESLVVVIGEATLRIRRKSSSHGPALSAETIKLLTTVVALKMLDVVDAEHVSESKFQSQDV
jgi:hypothetical protein